MTKKSFTTLKLGHKYDPAAWRASLSRRTGKGTFTRVTKDAIFLVGYDQKL
jgi:hypothetical protein